MKYRESTSLAHSAFLLVTYVKKADQFFLSISKEGTWLIKSLLRRHRKEKQNKSEIMMSP